MKNALIFGVTGQDGYYLSKLLVEKDYRVFGVSRHPLSISSAERRELGVEILEGNLVNKEDVNEILQQSQPDEVYNLAGESSVSSAWQDPADYCLTNSFGVANLLQVLSTVSVGAKPRYFQASSSEMFGDTGEKPIDELTPLNPKNPYGATKVYAHTLTGLFRNFMRLHASSGILFNHESPLRSEKYVTKKICRAAVKIYLRGDGHLTLGNIKAKRDWSFARDVVEAVWLMLQQEVPDDYIVASGSLNSVEQFTEGVFNYLGVKDWKRFVSSQEELRPTDVLATVGNASKARNVLGWRPSTSFSDLIALLVEAELKHQTQL